MPACHSTCIPTPPIPALLVFECTPFGGGVFLFAGSGELRQAGKPERAGNLPGKYIVLPATGSGPADPQGRKSGRFLFEVGLVRSVVARPAFGRLLLDSPRAGAVLLSFHFGARWRAIPSAIASFMLSLLMRGRPRCPGRRARGEGSHQRNSRGAFFRAIACLCQCALIRLRSRLCC